MKKTLALLLALSVVFALAACGGTPDTESPAAVRPEYLAFTGDAHGEIAGYKSWNTELLSALGGELVYLSYSGDICDKNWEEPVFTELKAALDELMPDKYGVTTGNQEWKAGAPGPLWDELGSGFVRCGVAAQTDTYIVYNFGASSEQMQFSPEDIAALSDFLAAAPKNIPVFVVSHYSLHDFVKADIAGGGFRCCANSGEVIDLLNNYPNVIFLWGHNHSFADPRYGTIRLAGEQMTYDYANPTAKKTIQFTYANYGCFCRGSSYGLVASVFPSDDGADVFLDYYDAAEPDATKDSANLLITADGVTAKLTKGTAVSEENILLYSGYPDDPDFVSAYPEA